MIYVLWKHCSVCQKHFSSEKYFKLSWKIIFRVQHSHWSINEAFSLDSSESEWAILMQTFTEQVVMKPDWTWMEMGKWSGTGDSYDTFWNLQAYCLQLHTWPNALEAYLLQREIVCLDFFLFFIQDMSNNCLKTVIKGKYKGIPKIDTKQI